MVACMIILYPNVGLKFLVSSADVTLMFFYHSSGFLTFPGFRLLRDGVWTPKPSPQ